MKIQINSLDALERLLGNDQTMEIEVRRSVIEAFAKTFVKAVGNEADVKAQIQHSKKEAERLVREYARENLGLDPELGNLSSRTKSEIQSLVLHQIRDIVNETVKRELRSFESIVNKKIAERLDVLVEHYLKEYNDARILTAVEKVLKEL